MAVHTELSPTEAADRLALRELFDAYAHCADRRVRRRGEGAFHRRHTIRTRLDQAAFAEAWEQGRTLTIGEAVTLALAC